MKAHSSMTHFDLSSPIDLETLAAAADRAARAIPPLWPLASHVAVNPYLGQAGEGLAVAGARLARVAGAPVTLPRQAYLDQIARGEITDGDLAAALAGAPADFDLTDVEALKAAARRPSGHPRALPTVADLAAEVSGVDWPGLIADRIGAWAAGYFDAGQALWAAPRGRGAYAAWRAVATHDLTPEIIGLPGFAAFVSEAPEHAWEARAQIVAGLGLTESALETCFHRLLMTPGGWAQFARYQLWQAELAGGGDETLTDLLTLRLVWEAALHARYADRIGERWAEVVAAHARPVTPSPDLVIDSLLQEAAERAAQRGLAARLGAPGRVRAALGPRPDRA